MRAFVPTAVDRRRALGILCIGVGVVLAALYVPLLQPWWQAESQLWHLKTRIAEAQKTLGKASEIDAEFSAKREQLLASGTYLPESSVALANAGLAQRLQQAASDAATDDSACVLASRLPVEVDRSPPGCREVRVQVSMQCGGVALQRFLQGIETTPPRLRIDRMTVALSPSRLGFDKPMTRNQPLDVSFEVVGCLFPASLTAGDRLPSR